MASKGACSWAICSANWGGAMEHGGFKDGFFLGVLGEVIGPGQEKGLDRGRGIRKGRLRHPLG